VRGHSAAYDQGRISVCGENGKGVATCRTANGWSAPAFFAITGGSWGLQIGVEGVDLVMIFQGDRGMQRLENAKFQIGADASAAAGPVDAMPLPILTGS